MKYIRLKAFIQLILSVYSHQPSLIVNHITSDISLLEVLTLLKRHLAVLVFFLIVLLLTNYKLQYVTNMYVPVSRSNIN